MSAGPHTGIVQETPTPAAAPAGQDGDVPDTDTVVQLALLQAELEYDLGHFARAWDALDEALEHLEAPELSLGVRGILLTLEARRHHADPTGAERCMSSAQAVVDEEDDRKVSPHERRQVEVLLVAVRTWLAQQDRDHRVAAEAAARAAWTRARRSGEALERTRSAYFALLAGDDHSAVALLEADGGPPPSWRAGCLLAVGRSRTGDHVPALKSLREAVANRRHDLDLRCTLGYALLLAGEVEEALREASALVAFAPGHTHARLLLGECLYRASSRGAVAAKGPAASTTAPPPVDLWQLSTAVDHLREAVRLHDGLAERLAGRPVPDDRVGSDLLSRDALIHAVRRIGHAALHMELGSAGRPTRRSLRLLREAHTLAERLREHAPMDSARLVALVRSARWSQRRRLASTWGRVPAALVLVVLALRFSPDDAGQLTSQRAILLVVAAAVLLWPSVSKFGLLGLQVERAAPGPPVADAHVLQEGSFASGGALMRLLVPMTPPQAVKDAVAGPRGGEASRELPQNPMQTPTQDEITRGAASRLRPGPERPGGPASG